MMQTFAEVVGELPMQINWVPDPLRAMVDVPELLSTMTLQVDDVQVEPPKTFTLERGDAPL